MSIRHHTVQTNVNLVLSLAYFPLPLVSGVERLRIQLGGTVLQQMLFAIVVAKGATGSNYVAPPLEQINSVPESLEAQPINS